MNFLSRIFGTLAGYCFIFVCRYILRLNRLKKVPMIPIGASLQEIDDLYGNPERKEEDEDDPNKTVYTFDAIFHEIIVTVAEDRVVGVSYWTNPDDARPDKDLEFVLKEYGEGQEWRELTPGYSAVRADGRRRANFSAIPAIGVMEVDYPGVREDTEASQNDGDEQVGDGKPDPAAS